MTEESNDHMEVDVSVLRALSRSVAPIQHKIASVIADHYSSTYSLSESQLITFLETHLSCLVLVRSVEELSQQAKDAKVKIVLMKPEEIVLMSTMVTSIDNVKNYAYESGISLLEH